MEQRHAARKLNIENIMEDYNNHDPCLTQLLLHKQSIKIQESKI
jgi:hypothetical protein